MAGGSIWEGRLPDHLDFNQVETHLGAITGALIGTTRADTRTIEFYPSNAHVYEDLGELLAVASNRRRIPDRFALRSLNFAYPAAAGLETPDVVAKYMDAVRLWAVLRDMADVNNGGLLFVASHDAQVTIRADFRLEDLRRLKPFPTFAAEFSNHESHADQKRSIIRSVLIEQFRPQRSVAFAAVLDRFDAIATDARQSLAMYMAEFSVAKVKSEVERQNLDDTLSLNKTLSDIQNQLLALPAAILLAGATVRAGEDVRNTAVLFGVVIFSIFMLTLVSNQRHSIDAISTQVARRKEKVNSMPGDSNSEILPLFKSLETRVSRQRWVLRFISLIVVVVALLTTCAVMDINGIRYFRV